MQPFIAFRELCEARVNNDNCEFGIDSIYLPNPILTHTPEWCLVAMEPSLSGMSPAESQARVRLGFLNFLWSEGDFILHYCAYTFLCNGAFGYHITDISKGAMNTAVANSQRGERYGNWLVILKHELTLLNNPRLIAIGSRARDFLHKTNFSVDRSVMHYSQNNSARFRDYYLQHPNKSVASTIHMKLRDFASGLLNALDYDSWLEAFYSQQTFQR